jgi:hypothetical protein
MDVIELDAARYFRPLAPVATGTLGDISPRVR